jgi:acetyl-CoA synthetase
MSPQPPASSSPVAPSTAIVALSQTSPSTALAQPRQRVAGATTSAPRLTTPAYPWAIYPPSFEGMREQLGLPNATYGYNVGALCTTAHLATRAKATALIWVGAYGQTERYSFADMDAASNRWANLLQHLGVQAGDRVFVYMERWPEQYQAILGGLKLGAIVAPLFAAFGTDAIADRLADAGAKLIITTPNQKPRVDAVRGQLPALEHVVVVSRGATHPLMQAGDHDANYLLPLQSAEFTPQWTAAVMPSIMHYTSGTTGKPKGALHKHEAVVAQAATTQAVLDLVPERDVYWCTADPGWVTGTAYGIVGPWALGITQLVTEAGFKAETWYELLQNYRVTVWYTAPTALRLLMKAGKDIPQRYDFSQLRHIASVGEPLNPEAYTWGQQVFKRSIVDTWWQTETGAMHIVNRLGLPVKPGSMGQPFPGVEATILDDQYQPLPPNTEGHLALRATSPSFFLGYWGAEEKTQSRFKNGWYLTGDRAKCDAQGYYWFIGRDDDVINTAGHLVGPFEVENALVSHPAVAEAGVIGVPDEERMEAIMAFVALKVGFTPSDELRHDIQTHVRQHLAAHAYPRQVVFVESLPKTRSGKIMRRVLKARALGLPEGDVSGLEND